MYRIEKWKHSRFWAVLDAAGGLVCLCVYRKGAKEVARRLGGMGDTRGNRDAPV